MGQHKDFPLAAGATELTVGKAWGTTGWGLNNNVVPKVDGTEKLSMIAQGKTASRYEVAAAGTDKTKCAKHYMLAQAGTK